MKDTKNKISQSYFSSLWEGISWKNIHYDVYTEENLEYYKYKTCLGKRAQNAIFDDNEIINLRTRFISETPKQIYESIKDKCSFNTLKDILYGKSYRNLPIYNKQQKVWINN